MKTSGKYLLFAILVFVGINNAYPRKVHNKHYKFTITLPDSMMEIQDSFNAVAGQLYYDTTNGILLLVSARESKFKSVKDYVDCSKEQLEQQLRNDYGDSTLTLISCDIPEYYPKKTTKLHFRVSILPYGFNTYTIYFIHHKHKDIQFSFTYKKEKEQSIQHNIKYIMRTLYLH